MILRFIGDSLSLTGQLNAYNIVLTGETSPIFRAKIGTPLSKQIQIKYPVIIVTNLLKPNLVCH